MRIAMLNRKANASLAEESRDGRINDLVEEI